MPEPTLCCRCQFESYCDRCDLLVGLPGLHVVEVERDAHEGLRAVVESAASGMGCPVCGVLAVGHGRVAVRLIDTPAFGQPVQITWRKRRWRCPDSDCPHSSFVEQDDDVARARALLTRRACRWAECPSYAPSTPRSPAWPAAWARPGAPCGHRSGRCFRPPPMTNPASPASPPSEWIHVWHHVCTKPPTPGGRGRGPKELTGMVDLSKHKKGKVRARLLDLVPGRTGAAYSGWLEQRGAAFRRRVKVATLNPFHGYKNAIDDKLADATAVLDAFHVVKLGSQSVDEVRRRVQQQTLGHRGRRGDPLYGIRTILRAGAERLTPRQQAHLHTVFPCLSR